MNPDDLAKGATFLDVITASNVAYAMSLIKNGRLLVWIDQLRRGKAKHNGDETDAINEMMIADEEEQEKEDEDEDEDEEGGVKKTKKKTKTKTKKLQPLFTAGEGKKRTTALENWKPAFDSKDIQNKILRRHWDTRWLETEGRDMNIELDGIYTKSMYNILRP